MRRLALLLLLIAPLARAERPASTPSTTSLFSPKLFGRSGTLVDKSMNPAISVSGLFMGTAGSAISPADRGIDLREIEAVFTAAVDPYFLGNVVINKEKDDKFFGVEEAYMVTLGLPLVTVRAGKYRVFFGKDNQLHTHALPLIDRPLTTRKLLDEDGLDSFGVQASILVPVPWYMDLTVGGLSASRTPVFASPNSEAIAGNARLSNLFDLSDEATLEIGGSYAGGNNAAARSSHYLGADVSLKYRSLAGKGNLAIAWVNELVHATRNGLGGATSDTWEEGWGFYSSVLNRFFQRFWLGVRFDYLKTMPLAGAEITTGQNLMAAWVPTEFSAIQVQAGLYQTRGKPGSDWQALVQYNMTIGSHPAHAY
jgi:hypothetical protein